MLKVPLQKNELDHLAAVITELEKKTVGEIRLILVRSSSQTGHVRWLLFLIFFSLSLLGLWLERHYFVWQGDWWFVPAIALIDFALACLLSTWSVAIRALSPTADLRRQALIRAELEFHREGLGHTLERTGILLFVSLLEHQAVVLADKGIHSRLEDSTWEQVVASMLEGPKSGQWAKSLEKALRQCGEVLAKHFPTVPGNKNELSNQVIVKD